jgi:hypothetical protein
MRKLVVFNQVTLDGCFAGEHGDISWAHRDIESACWARGERCSRASARGPLKPTRTRTFDNGNVLLCYEPTR